MRSPASDAVGELIPFHTLYCSLALLPHTPLIPPGGAPEPGTIHPDDVLEGCRHSSSPHGRQTVHSMRFRHPNPKKFPAPPLGSRVIRAHMTYLKSHAYCIRPYSFHREFLPCHSSSTLRVMFNRAPQQKPLMSVAYPATHWVAVILRRRPYFVIVVSDRSTISRVRGVLGNYTNAKIFMVTRRPAQVSKHIPLTHLPRCPVQISPPYAPPRPNTR